MTSLQPRPLLDGITGRHLAPLDGLRGLAILLVMLYHFCLPHAKFHGREAGWLLQFGQVGWMGVDLFFVLSGFLITGILHETRDQPHYFRNFFWRRFLRIWPLYYASLVVLLLVLPAVLPSMPDSLRSMQEKQWWFWLYSANWLFAKEGGFNDTSGGYFWSLAVEEQFYLVWPLVVYWLSPRNLLRSSITLLLLSLGLRLVLLPMGTSTGTLYTMTFTHLDGLAVGSVLALWSRSADHTLLLRRAALPVALAAVIGLLVARHFDRDMFFWSKHMAAYGYSLVALLGGALLVAVLKAPVGSPLTRLFTLPPMRLCGKYSYALYVVHVPIANIAFPATSRLAQRFAPATSYDAVFVASMLLSFALSWIVAVLSWHLFEKRILALKRHFTYEEQPTRRAADPVPR